MYNIEGVIVEQGIRDNVFR